MFSPDEIGGELKCIFDTGEGMITTADDSMMCSVRRDDPCRSG